MSRKIYGFAGRAKSGKTTLSNILRDERGAKVLTIASYLKNLTCELLGLDYEVMMEYKNNGEKINAIPDERWSEVIAEKTGLDKAVIAEELAKYPVIATVRDALQIIGTDIIRKYYPDWHIDSLINELHSLPEDTIIAVDDIRFPNELRKIEEEGGEVFFILRPSTIFESSNHISETALNWKDVKDLGHVILNNPYTTIEDLKKSILWKFDGSADILGGTFCFGDNFAYNFANVQKRVDAFATMDENLKDAISLYVNRLSTRNATEKKGWLTFTLFDKSDYQFIWRFTKALTGRPYIFFNTDKYTLVDPFVVEELKLFVKK